MMRYTMYRTRIRVGDIAFHEIANESSRCSAYDTRTRSPMGTAPRRVGDGDGDVEVRNETRRLADGEVLR